jgi:hypothetical protein
MGILKMTNILVSTNDFIVTATHPEKSKKIRDLKEYFDTTDNIPIVIEIIPIFTEAAKKRKLADRFYNIITIKNSHGSRRQYDEKIWNFAHMCTRAIWDQILDSMRFEFIDSLALADLPVLIILRDRDGGIRKSQDSTIKYVSDALTHFETGCIFTGISKKRNAHELSPLPLKERKKETTRRPHKYFLQHRVCSTK